MTEQQQRELTEGLRALADTTRDARAGQQVEAAVLAEMAAHAARESTSHAAREGTSHVARRTFLPLAAALILAVGTGVWFARIAPLREPIHPAGFVALPGAAWLPEMESATIVRVSLPVAALPAYGVAIQPDAISGAVLAELLVAQDGQPRAIRFVNDSD